MRESSATELKNHEQIEVKEPVSARRRIVRQTRISVPPERCHIMLGGTKLEVLNYSAFGILAQGTGEIQTVEDHVNVPLIHADIEVGRYHLRVIRTSQENTTKSEIAFEVMGEPIDTLLINAIDKATELVADHKISLQEENTIPPLFRHRVLEIKDWLEGLQEKCERLEEQLNWESPDVNKLRNHIAQVVGLSLNNSLPPVYKALQKELTQIPKENLRLCVEYFRQKLKHLIYKSPLAQRAYQKPLGYAGDYQMMNIMYENLHGGDSLFAKCIHSYFVQEPASKAVRSRAKFLQTKLLETIEKVPQNETVRICSVACGPAREIELLLSNTSKFSNRTIEFHLLDQDYEALADAQKRLKIASKRSQTNFTFHYHNLAIKNIIGRGLPVKGCHLIYSAGLFDYFSDPVAMMAGEKLFNAVAPNGMLVIGNFDIKNPSQQVMEFVLDWELIYRSSQELTRLFSHLGGQVRIEEETEGINLFCSIEKKG